MSGRVSVGVDMVRVSEVMESLVWFGQRYADRVFTAHEQASCTGELEVRARGLAARFAAKEATMKVLRPTTDVPAWTSIEVQRQPAGWCEISLSGAAQTLAEQAGIEDFSVSFTHEGDSATAVVVAVSGERNHTNEL